MNFITKINQKLRKNIYPVYIDQENIYGSRLRFKVNNQVENYRINSYGGEKNFLDSFCASLNEEDIVYDVGASVGLMTIHAASIVKRGMVYSFEPDVETFDRLKNNVKLNNFSNVNLNRTALGDKDGNSLLFTDGASGYAPSMRKQEGRVGAPQNAIQVMSRKLDTLIENEKLPIPSVIKIDIEGAEVLFLRGAENLLRGLLGVRPRLIFMEVHPKFLSQFESSIDDVVSKIIQYGYCTSWSESRENEIQYCFRELTIQLEP